MPGEYDFVIPQGETISRLLTWNDAGGSPIDITGYTARMDVRKAKDSVDRELQLTSGAGELVLGGAAGTITLTLTDTVTAAILADQYVYDMELVSGVGDVTKLLKGKFTVTQEVTR